ncbi:hypothetical protein FGO68_gene16687 [Halteria grandinella]|uniref:VPS9 domain-containing protein n=1 Tax=Halteria grandinella TaxID=5974 RepID=A0A8J8NED9_HALGN|nr:hypothetical protein FGO68_gene16687 [Halteria grandinella]
MNSTNNGYDSTASTSSNKRLSTFYKKIQEPRSKPVRDILEQFYEDEKHVLKDQTSQKERREQSERVQQLMSDLEEVFQDIHEESETDRILSGEGIEKTVCKNFYESIFHIALLEDDYNNQLIEKIALLQHHVTPKHLDLPEERVIKDRLLYAVARLAQWNAPQNKSPFDKLRCLIDFVKSLSHMLSETRLDPSNPDGADILLPCTIYALLQMTQQQATLLKSNLEYIRLFRHAERLDGQEEYYLTQMESAAEFLYKAGWGDLNGVSEVEYRGWQGPRVVEDMIDFSQSPTKVDNQESKSQTREEEKQREQSKSNNGTVSEHPAISNYKDAVSEILRKDFDSLTIQDLKALHLQSQILLQSVQFCVQQNVDLLQL